jgi:hypothetical protein
MGQVMNAGTARWTYSAAAPSGRFLAVVAAAAFLIAGLTGNSFSLHVGMTASASEAAFAVDRAADAVAGTGAGSNAVSDAAPDATAPMTVGSDALHLMHLIGACLAVLAAAASFLRLFSQARALLGSHPAVTALPRPLTPPPGGSWSPPPPSPPTSSRVIRT